ncbi:tetratricopeptide repeat protein [Sinorhizobium meliloti]|uniref:tetratricopeptide repeat protein n=1 Tax=Rhizobium meliloti TaxID=382 RepID=UPI000FD759FB|nr:tetratricopeptide repeat protein [Sinorhizobium meliloti]RVI51048.1 tetratricopeptide repeat protein [Sinorhizobium meliloti]RVN06963.1 tetratricopeptide repeat protein [Sinorhizobium meliloti]RVN18110.1 tetratricopeptide repeat protein [Sinorhizobium meliloti]RVN35247.1 tetratricopeptide repeat protein [Sinorhizobium meliloti]RVO04379.1 tetratricopeptide repeat protein [Sinorhizobium meliloti]
MAFEQPGDLTKGMSAQVEGDASRQATASLRGYAYQIYASAIAWMTLPEDGFLHLEVAEDYSTLVSNTLNAVQVKATKAAITLNSKSVVDAINAFFLLRERNSDRRLTMEYLTTAEIGLEAEIAHRVNGEAGIRYWAAASEGADVGLLKARLLQMPLSAAAKDFLSKASDEAIRGELLTRLRWRCGEPGIVDVRRRLLDQAGAYCSREGEPVVYADRFVDRLVGNIIEAVVAGEKEGRTRIDLDKAFQEVARVSVPASALDKILRQGLIGQDAGRSLAVAPAFEPLPYGAMNLAPRETLIEQAIAALSESGVAWFHAGAGYGKTTIATLVAERSGNPWNVVRLRGMDAAAMASKLRRVAIELEISSSVDLVLDDLDHLSNPDVQEALCALLGTRQRLSARLMITSNQPPAPMRSRRWFGSASVTVPVLDFTEAEVSDLVEAEGGDPERFGRYAYFGSGAGHPQLAHALILGLKDRGWPYSEVQTLAALTGMDVDVEAVRAEIRSRLVSELPDDQLHLLARLTLVFGAFSRPFALALAETGSPIPIPGRAFEGLHGPWIDQVTGQKYRPSSLVSTLGKETLGPTEIKEFNAEIARLRIRGGSLDAGEVDGILSNALLGEADDVIEVVFAATVASDRTDLPRLVDAFPTLLAMSADRPLYQKSPTIAAKLRMIQVLLLAAKGSSTRLQASLHALDSELLLLADTSYANVLRISTLSKLMFQPGVIDILPGAMGRLAALLHDPLAIEYAANLSEVGGQPSSIDFMVRAIFAAQLASVRHISTISRLLDEISQLDEGDRAFFLRPFVHHAGDKAIAVKAPWSAGVVNGFPGTEELAGEYIALAEKARAIGDSEIASAALETAATIYDEDLKRPERALEILIDAIEKNPDYEWSLQRHRARVLFHMQRYEEQLQIVAPLLPGADRANIEMAYFLREIAIGNSHLGKHDTAADHYADAAARASASELADLQLMSLGLKADEAVEAFWAGQGHRAISRLAEVLPALEQVNMTAGLRQKALRSYIPHTVAWMVNHAIPGVAEPDFEYAMAKGLNSNPNPDPAIAQLRRGPIEFVWAMLSELETRLGVDAGVGRSMILPRWDLQIPTLADFMLRKDLHKRSVVTGDVRGFCDTLPGFMAGILWVNSAAGDLDPFNSPTGRVPKLADEQVLRHGTFVVARALTFMLALTLQGQSERVDEFIELQSALDRPMLSPEHIEAFRRGELLNPDDEIQSNVIGAIYQHFTAGRRMTPTELFIAGVRIVEMATTDLTGHLKSLGYDWYSSEWTRVAAEQRFQLRLPAAIDDAIIHVVALGKTGHVGIAAMALSMRGQVNVNLPADTLAMLRGTAAQ